MMSSAPVSRNKSAVGRVALAQDAGQIVKTSPSAEAQRRKVMKRVEAYRKALEQLGVDKEVSSLSSGDSGSKGSSKSSKGRKSRKGKRTSGNSKPVSGRPKQTDTVSKQASTTFQEVEIPPIRTRQSFTLLRSDSSKEIAKSAPNASKWVRLSETLNRSEAEILRYKVSARKPLPNRLIARDSVEVALVQKERRESRAIPDESDDAEQLPVATRKSLELVRFTEFDMNLVRNPRRPSAVVTNSLADLMNDEEEEEKEVVSHHEQENSQDWEDPMLDEGFDLSSLQFANGGSILDIQEDEYESDDDFGGIEPLMEPLMEPVEEPTTDLDAKCEWDEWWDWYQEAAAYTESMEQLSQIDVPVSVCYVTHINSYLLDDQEMPTMAWQANEMESGHKHTKRLSSGSSTSASSAGGHSNSSMGSGNSILKRRKNSVPKKVRFASEPLSVGYTLAYDDDNSSVDSMDDIMKFYSHYDEDESPRFGTSICIESDSDESDSEYETSSSDDESESEDESNSSEDESSEEESDSDWTDEEQDVETSNDNEKDDDSVDEDLILSMFMRDGTSDSSLETRKAMQKANSKELLESSRNDSTERSEFESDALAKAASLESLLLSDIDAAAKDDENASTNSDEDLEMDSVFGDLEKDAEDIDLSQFMSSGNPLFGTDDDDDDEAEIMALSSKRSLKFSLGGPPSSFGKMVKGMVRRLSSRSSVRK